MRKSKVWITCIVLAVLSVALQISSVALTNTVSLQYWYASGESEVWYSSVPIYARCYDNELGFYSNLYSAMTNGITLWNNANFLPFTITRTTSDNENVRYYGGSYSYLITAFPGLGADAEGYAPIVEPAGSTGAAWSGYTKTIFRFDGTEKRKVAIVDVGSDVSQYKIVGAHEMWHVLGWIGHTNNSTQLMYGAGATSTSVKAQDKYHIKQVYDALY